jgi:hypothetical protein
MTLGLGVIPSGLRCPTESTTPHLLSIFVIGTLQLASLPDQFEVVFAKIDAVSRFSILFLVLRCHLCHLVAPFLLSLFRAYYGNPPPDHCNHAQYLNRSML